MHALKLIQNIENELERQGKLKHPAKWLDAEHNIYGQLAWVLEVDNINNTLWTDKGCITRRSEVVI